ncbi:methyl-accepting chemotaxis protein [Aquincola tertiaricarbonis]|uniref:Methyl-accepting chemotaxis protein n=1 Tax=Aquincola tertiaricarbonis TaxID=391953 RepID=A0ABY4SEG1_AQUTE|nr:methyl-accepting chemotaxis protein [Aquincola tertiaricarbonis]URI11368.1 methyl-accepting chemotaxis protein [Aquincola tertiaricarbonis]
MKIGTRLAAGFGLLLALLLAMAALSAREARVIYEALDYYTANVTPSLTAIKGWQDRIDEIRTLQAKHLLTESPAERANIESAWQAASERLRQGATDYERLLSSEEERQLWLEVMAQLQAATAAWEELHALSNQAVGDAAQGPAARRLFLGEAEQHYRMTARAIDAVWAYNTRMAEQLTTDGQHTYQLALKLIAGVSLLALLLGAGAALLITRSITLQMGGEPREVLQVAQAIAEGDLSVDFALPPGRSRSVVGAIRIMRDRLADLVGQVRHSSDSIATGSAHVAGGSADLSQRTEEQASNLQQTAAAVEQLSSTVRSNAETARQADQLAAQASAAAAQGGAVVGQMAATMQDIAAASQRIADIIGVIDGIAFQTNLLALNAAVEAARAGDHGRGFAVVAGEVRALAQRSAQAAKEIKSLIGDSVGRVEAGSRQAQAAGASMGDTVAQVRHVSELIAAISLATSEQSTGIGQVGHAVGQLDSVTQQNAALVEESAAAADSLKQQADRLTALVGTFKLRESASAG